MVVLSDFSVMCNSTKSAIYKSTSDVNISNFYSHITLNGNATIGALALNFVNNPSNSSVVIGSDWTGRVGSLNLLGSLDDMDTHIARCAGRQVVRAEARYTLKILI